MSDRQPDLSQAVTDFMIMIGRQVQEANQRMEKLAAKERERA